LELHSQNLRWNVVACDSYWSHQGYEQKLIFQKNCTEGITSQESMI